MQNNTEEDTSASIFIAALFTVIKSYKQLINEKMNKEKINSDNMLGK